MRVRKAILSLGLLLLLFAILKFVFYLKHSIEVSPSHGDTLVTFNNNIPADINFAGEPVPINDFRVRKILDEQLTDLLYSKTSSHLFHKNSARWFKTISPLLKANGIPDDFKYVALIESHFSNSVSKRGAAGFWQFVEGTAKDLGLLINNEVDERLHIEKSTLAACKFFKNAYKKLGSWTLVAAAYNMGLEGLQSKIKNQKISSYYKLDLSNETSLYVYKILAMKEIITRPEVYGYKINKSALYPSIPVRKIKLDSSLTDLKHIAKSLNVPVKILRNFNPWIIGNRLTVNDSLNYEIQIPDKSVSEAFILKLMEQDSTNASRLTKATISN